jgi:hypothetical protein
MRTRRVTLCFAGLALLASAASLPADPFPAITEDRLVATWTAQEGDTRHLITFLKDGAFKGKCYVKDALSFEYEGQWKLNHDWPPGFRLPVQSIGPGLDGPDVRFIHYTYTSWPGMKPGTQDVDCVYHSDAKTMTLITLKGVWRLYTRADDKSAP